MVLNQASGELNSGQMDLKGKPESKSQQTFQLDADLTKSHSGIRFGNRPYVLTKAEKQRMYDIEVANEALLKKMMKIVSVSQTFQPNFVFSAAQKQVQLEIPEQSLSTLAPSVSHSIDWQFEHHHFSNKIEFPSDTRSADFVF